MDAVDRAIARLEALSGQDIQKRNIGPLAAHVRGNLARAAESIARHPAPSIAIITGFFLEHGEPPNCETDGPPGALMLAAGFSSVGIPCRVATDVANAQVVLATRAGAELEGEIPLDIISMHETGGDGGKPLPDVDRLWRAMQPAITHVIAIERCGPSLDGAPRDARGVDITNYNAPLERLFNGGPWTTIGIGDLGNEIGMGSLPHDLVAKNIAGGDKLWCHVGCDYPIVGGVSNWAGAALLGAVALLWPGPATGMLDSIRPEFGRRLLEAAVRNGGAVASDRVGGTPRPQLFVDGQPWSVLEQIHEEIYDACVRTMEIRDPAGRE
ncbi:hypothetical protein FRZ61_46790 [Hypericibacter adhaerens]|jgi:hypothetical protein|uniref:D-glutamate cyclase-like C-terminal domain-containing protein n=1 Tax=Hypericibacter adhaerens TaxID=2602016 RepID=A0A5J6N494_9PROT|nr:glutamate cyclase domain-containing protein [Hypericibacter adhaerens]QEX24738.1 hypothetical protein FRZ61_46790 [Hypericibacter adhaerens]